MVWPLIIGAAIGGVMGGMSGEDGWDWKRALMGAGLGAATGGVGAGALGGTSALGGVGAAKGSALAGGSLAGSVGGKGAAGLAAIQSGGMATTTSGLGAGLGSTAIPAGLSGTSAYGGLSFGMGPQALAASGAQTGSLAGLTSTPLMHSYANPNVGSQFTKTGSQFMTDKTAGKGLNYDALGQGVKSMGKQVGQREAERSKPMDHAKPPPLRAMTSGESSSIAKDLAAELQSIHNFPAKRITPGLGNISTAAKGGIATRFGMMKTPSGSLTGGEIVGPGTGTSDTIRSAIYPDVASKLGASSSPIGQGHQVQNAALSDGEFVLTAKAVEGVGRNAGAPPGQEREFGSKLLDQAMNQWQRA